MNAVVALDQPGGISVDDARLDRLGLRADLSFVNNGMPRAGDLPYHYRANNEAARDPRAARHNSVPIMHPVVPRAAGSCLPLAPLCGICRENDAPPRSPRSMTSVARRSGPLVALGLGLPDLALAAADSIKIFGIAIEFLLFAAVLLGIAAFHRHALRIAVGGLARRSALQARVHGLPARPRGRRAWYRTWSTSG